MAKLTLADLVNLNNETTAVNTINANSALIETALENTLSRDGTTPNQMGADLDMNSNSILNMGSLNMAGHKITNLADGSLIGDAINYGQLISIVTGITDISLAGLGDVHGPSSSVNNRVVVFDGITGKLIKDSGVLVSSLGDVVGPSSSVNNRMAMFNGTTGKLIKDSGISYPSTSNVVGDILYADTSTSFARLLSVARGFVLGTSGVGGAPLYVTGLQKLYYNATDPLYGAVCNGVTDDTAALAAVITAANLTGGIVQLPGNGSTCLTSASLMPDSGVIIQGAGMAGASPGVTTTKFGTTIKWTGVKGGSVIKFVDNGVAMGVRDLRIDGNQLSPDGSSAFGVHIQSNTDVLIENVAVENIGYCFVWIGTVAGVARASGADGKYSNLRCHNTYSGVYFDGGNCEVTAAVTDFDIFGLKIQNYVNAAISFNGCLDDIKIHGVYIQATLSGSTGIAYNPRGDGLPQTPTGTIIDSLTYAGTSGAQFISCKDSGDSPHIVSSVFAFGGTITPNIQAGCVLNWNSQLDGTIMTGGVINSTSKDGYILENPKAATVSQQQWSPRIRLTGQGWKTTSTAASQKVDWIIENQTVSGTTHPTSNLLFGYQVNDGGYSYLGTMTEIGVLDMATGFRIAGSATSGNVLRGNGTVFISSSLGVTDLSGFGTGVATALGTNVGTAGSFVVSGGSTTTGIGFGAAPNSTNVIQITSGSAVSKFIDVINSAGEAIYGVDASGFAYAWSINNSTIFGTASNFDTRFFVNNINAFSVVTGASLALTSVAVKSTLAATSRTAASLTVAGGLGVSGTIYANLANVNTTSAVCYNTSSGLFSYNGTAGTCDTSDGDLKNIDGPLTSALDKLLQIKGVYFHWKDETFGNGRQVGVIAQDVEKVFPELVGIDSMGHRSAHYPRLTAPIIEAIRELKEEIEQLKQLNKEFRQ